MRREQELMSICEYCGQEYEEYADDGPDVCPECLWKGSEINPKNRPIKEGEGDE